MIPETAISFNDDGTALWVGGPELALYDDDNRPCDTCDGSSLDLTPESIMQTFSKRMDGAPAGTVGVRPCPDCGGTGRHTFEIEVESGDRDRMMHWPVTLTYSVHVIDVLPIVDNGHDMVAVYDEGCVLMTQHKDTGAPLHLFVKVGEPVKLLTLPPDAAPGMWLVRLAVML